MRRDTTLSLYYKQQSPIRSFRFNHDSSRPDRSGKCRNDAGHRYRWPEGGHARPQQVPTPSSPSIFALPFAVGTDTQNPSLGRDGGIAAAESPLVPERFSSATSLSPSPGANLSTIFQFCELRELYRLCVV